MAVPGGAVQSADFAAMKAVFPTRDYYRRHAVA
jgi:hypothetical protein